MKTPIASTWICRKVRCGQLCLIDAGVFTYVNFAQHDNTRTSPLMRLPAMQVRSMCVDLFHDTQSVHVVHEVPAMRLHVMHKHRLFLICATQNAYSIICKCRINVVKI